MKLFVDGNRWRGEVIMEFRVLGPLEVRYGDREVVPSAPKIRAALALLVVQNSRGVHTHKLINELWGENPPVSAIQTLQTYIYQLRKILGNGNSDGGLVQTRPDGYALAIDAGSLDLSRFEQLVRDGREALGNQDPQSATKLLTEAQSLWRGPALANVAVGQVLSAEVTRLEEVRLHGLHMRIDADLILGRHSTLVSELKALIEIHPMHEGLRAKLMLALHRSGRRFEALDVYQQLRRFLSEELGLEPAEEVRRLHQALLNSDPSLDLASPPRQVAVVTRADAHVAAALSASPLAQAQFVPAQLPPDVPEFSGRAAEIRMLRRRLVPEQGHGTATPIVNITGSPGSGKTVLAIHAAHRLKERFPGGQLFAQLHGSEPVPADPFEVLGGFLNSVGMSVAQVPTELEERSSLFRSWCAERNVLIVLDNAASSEQIAPLIPGSKHCAVIVTSRVHALTGTQTMRLGPMSTEECLELLASVVGVHRVEAERAAAEEIIGLCGCMPIAVRAAAARLAASPTWPLSKLVRRLAEPGSRLQELSLGDLDVRSCYDQAYQRLGLADKSVFRLLGSLQLPQFGARHASELLGYGGKDVETLLDRLVDCDLLTVASNGQDDALSYSFPELAGIYARELLEHMIGSTDNGPAG
jgi:DNA-binding SARP family transcriptional activator